jgi:uroporphyrin-III C-methyltransferase/precorrin-2 dehydrogenase/sirohydrochlorin ferrochelatase
MTIGRAPETIYARKMKPLATLPLFHKLMGRLVIVAGSGQSAIWKAELVAATGAKVRFFLGCEISEEHSKTFQHTSNVELFSRAWSATDFVGASLAIAQSESIQDAESFVEAAKAIGIPVNIIDKPDYCDFQFGAIVNRSPLVISVSTDGAAPALGQVLRGRFEAMLPAGIAHWATKAAQWRPTIKAREPEFRERRAFWHRFAQKALANPTKEPNEKDFEELLNSPKTIGGQVVLLGAGPGDAELLTLKAVRALQNADVILFDDLVTQEVLDFARREAQFIAVGKRGKRPSTNQNEICQLLIEHASAGKNVIRIKGGDPLVFGRATEEIMACREADIPITIIPGISAAQSAAAALGVSLTDRVFAQRVQFVTGAGKNGGLPPEIDWAAVASRDTTTFIYMPRGTIDDFVRNAKAAGLPSKTPSAIIIDATRGTQKIYLTCLEGLPAKFAEIEPDGPELVMIGHVLENAKLNNGQLD